MLCKICNQNESTKKSYKGLCAACRTQKYAYSKGRKCEVCGTLVSNRSKLCITHQQEKRNQHVERACQACGKTYSTKPSDKVKYCSVPCMTSVSTPRLLALNILAVKETETIEGTGYVTVKVAGRRRRVRVHTLKAEKILGRRLKKGEGVHHWDMNKANNDNSNLLICTQEYHRWLHHQMAVQWVKKVLLPSRSMK